MRYHSLLSKFVIKTCAVGFRVEIDFCLRRTLYEVLRADPQLALVITMKPLAILLCLSLSLLAVQVQGGKTLAVLIATADQWHNYGMQADVYHAYQV